MTMRLSLSAVALLAGIGVAFAQQQPENPAAQNAPNAAAQNNEQAKPAQAGAEEPSSRAPSAAPEQTEALVNGKLAVPGAPQDSQTAPSKFSERNAKLDQEPLVKGQPTRPPR
jgi:hypothetical protein